MAQIFGDDSRLAPPVVRRGATAIRRCGAPPNRPHAYDSEAEILRGVALPSGRRALVLNIHGVVYTGEYEFNAVDEAADEWKPGDPIPARVAGDMLYLRRPNGGELQTTIVKRIG